MQGFCGVQALSPSPAALSGGTGPVPMLRSAVGRAVRSTGALRGICAASRTLPVDPRDAGFVGIAGSRAAVQTARAEQPSVGARAASSMAGSEEFGDPRRPLVFANYTIYKVCKGKGAVTLKLIRPTWVRSGSGNGISIQRDGTLLLEFATAKAEREYDWDRKETFALSAVECAEILEAAEAKGEVSFFHDPHKMGRQEGQVTKTLRMSTGAGATCFLNLSVADKSANARHQFSVPVSKAELRVLRVLMEVSSEESFAHDVAYLAQRTMRRRCLHAARRTFSNLVNAEGAIVSKKKLHDEGKYGGWKSAEILFSPPQEDRLNVVGRFDWHVWHILVGLVPSAVVAGVAMWARADMKESLNVELAYVRGKHLDLDVGLSRM
ncbi:Whirly transcription factor [Helicosporidium sp. ATCC 50920]|nr:Whirly transcription factor [Helicosporidium sp. ATCC 50920]|eukprot:KDD76494.1 Whirly transcription factor [Helicosporidium sp. ATCC 50920]